MFLIMHQKIEKKNKNKNKNKNKKKIEILRAKAVRKSQKKKNLFSWILNVRKHEIESTIESEQTSFVKR